MILSAIWNKLNEFTELHERSECNSLNEFNLFQMARKIISFDNNHIGQLPFPSPSPFPPIFMKNPQRRIIEVYLEEYFLVLVFSSIHQHPLEKL